MPGSAQEREDKQMLNRCNAGLAANMIVMGETKLAMDILESTNSYGQQVAPYPSDQPPPTLPDV